jgi:hypothetical protein
MISMADRTKKFAARVFVLIDHIPESPKGRVIHINRLRLLPLQRLLSSGATFSVPGGIHFEAQYRL